MPTKIEKNIRAALLQNGVAPTDQLVQALMTAVKPERKAPVVKRDDSEVREVVAEFCKASGLVAPPELFVKPSTWVAMNWLAPVTRIINQCNGKSKIAIVEGVRANRLARLTISSPKSVEALAKDWHAKQVAQAAPVSLTSSSALL